MTTLNITGTNTAGSARTRRLTKKQADGELQQGRRPGFPQISLKARVELGVIFWPVGYCICMGSRDRHTIFSPGIWWDVVDGKGGLK